MRYTDEPTGSRTTWRQNLMVVLLLAAAVASLVQVSVLRRPVPIDFTARYAAGQLVDRGVSPYDRTAVVAAEQALWPGLEELPFYDPPPTAAAFRLVARLPFKPAAAVWELLSVACLAVIGWLLADLLAVWRRTTRLAIICLLALFGPFRSSIGLGQIEAMVLLPLVVAIWLCMRRPRSATAVGWSSALAVASCSKPQLAYLPAAVVLGFCWRRNASASFLGAAMGAAAGAVGALLLAPSAHWDTWLVALRDKSEGPDGLLRLVMAVSGIIGIALVVRAARSCRGVFEGWLLLAASCNGLGAAVIGWNPQWHAVLALPVLTLLALFVVQEPDVWSRRERLLLALVAAICLPDAMSNVSFYTGMLHAVVPLTLSAMVLAGVMLGRLVSAPWAALIWVLTAALVVPPVNPSLGLDQVKGLVLCLAILWLLPQVAHVSRTGQPLELTSMRELRPA
jgi:hypothetical protein